MKIRLPSLIPTRAREAALRAQARLALRAARSAKAQAEDRGLPPKGLAKGPRWPEGEWTDTRLARWAARLSERALGSAAGEKVWARRLLERQAAQRQALRVPEERERWQGGAGSGLPTAMAYPHLARADRTPFFPPGELPPVVAPSRWPSWERACPEAAGRAGRRAAGFATPALGSMGTVAGAAAAALPGAAAGAAALADAKAALAAKGRWQRAGRGKDEGASLAGRLSGLSAAELAEEASRALDECLDAREQARSERRDAQAWRDLEALSGSPMGRKAPSALGKLAWRARTIARGAMHRPDGQDDEGRSWTLTPARALRTLPRELWSWPDWVLCMRILRGWPPASWAGDGASSLRGAVAAGLVLQLNVLEKPTAKASGQAPAALWSMIDEVFAQLVEGMNEPQGSKDAKWAWPMQEMNWECDIAPLHHLALRGLSARMLEILERSGVDIAEPGEMGNEPCEALMRGVYKAWLHLPAWRARAMGAFEFMAERAMERPALRRSLEYQLAAGAKAMEGRALANPRDFKPKAQMIEAMRARWEAMQLESAIGLGGRGHAAMTETDPIDEALFAEGEAIGEAEESLSPAAAKPRAGRARRL
jgi:hypothetical protein